MWRIQFWIVSIILAGVTRWTFAQKGSPAAVPKPVVNAKIGFTTNFTCDSHGLPINTCYWEKENPSDSDNPFTLTFNSGNTRPGQPGPEVGYSYIGDGLDKGQCGIVISVVKEEDNGKWKCRLFAERGVYLGNVDLEILRKPEQPKFSTQSLKSLEKLEIPQGGNQDIRPVNLTCYSSNGQPPPKFQWFLDDEPITDGLTLVENTEQESSHIYYQNLVNHRFQWTDNGKKLRCVIVHDALTESDLKETAAEINVQFAPRASRDGGNRVQIYANLGEATILAINVSANPRPTSTIWSVDGVQIPEKANQGRYFAESLKQLETGIYEARLKIDSVEEEDINKKFMLTVVNPYGNAEFELTVSSSSAGSGGLSAGGIVGLVLGIPAILIIIAAIVVYTRARGLLCFKGKGEDSHSTAHIDEKRSDLESGNENPGIGDGYPPSSQTPPLTKANGNSNGNGLIPPPAPTIPPPPLDDDVPIIYTNGNGRSVKDSPV